MASRLRAFEWRGHPLGPPSSWPLELRAAIGICMHSSMPTAVYWGPDLRLIYNDAWAPVPAERHPQALGEPAEAVWNDIWDVVGPQFREVVATGRGFSTFNQRLDMRRCGAVEETYWNYSLTPIFGEDGRVRGILNQGHETTEQVFAVRSQAFLLDIGDRLRDIPSAEFRSEAVLSTMLGALARHLDLPRCGYATVDGASGACTVVGNWRDERMPDLGARTFALADFGDAILNDMLAGHVVTSDDVALDRRHSPPVAENFEAVGVRANLVAPVVRGGRAFAFLFLNDDRPRRWRPHEIALARDLADRIWLALARADAAAKLRESERRFSVFFEQASVGLSQVTLDGAFVRINDSMGRILGRSPAAIEGLTIADVTHPDDLSETRARVFAATQSGGPFTLEKRYVKPGGAVTWAVTNVTRVVDEAGAPSGYFSVTTDISERKEQERIRAWLLAELNHRVKNNLSTVQAIAHHAIGSTSSLEEFERVFNARLMALSRAHDLLMRETWTSAALEDLVSDTLAPFALDDDRRIMIGGPEVRLSPTAAVTMTLAFHELATNAAKFGALSRPEGRVSVEWSIDRSRNGGAIDLEWREADGPIVAPPQRRGFGSRLIERGAARELGGRVSLQFDPAGVACAFHLPLSQKITVP
ncbi:PAS domain-containing sensor histidine kinase [Hansschlegelia zhihuaiae]|uniref:Blue-light-activated histidine kinase n=1 Tax=Hansschlegelia zhihuaiae TaxID=405005 RepID=A0A4Q0M6I3_9HYPH|nr:HWE histidine kinase domain-containing protein [Hansschlegelia zhihuaiae]RXF68463.1 PAS domain S-box protein [Hansschlegelia zhihuaiae]